jgi:hypothetical protein
MATVLSISSIYREYAFGSSPRFEAHYKAQG